MMSIQSIFPYSRPTWIPIIFLLTINADLLHGSTTFDEEFVSSKHFIDKTPLLKEFFKNNTTREFITAPQGFGKTTNLKMIERFSQVEFDLEGNLLAAENQTTAKLFKSLQIAEDETAMQHLGQHPVIFFDMAFDIEGEIDRDKILAAYNDQLKKTYSRYHGLIDPIRLKMLPLSAELDLMNRLKVGVVEEFAIKESIFFLARLLNVYFNKSVVLLVDNYDYIIHNALIDSKGFAEPVYSIFEEIITKCYQQKPQLIEYTMVTSVTTISFDCFGLHNYFKRSCFYDIHNYVYYFGLTHLEVEDLQSKYNGDEPPSETIDKYCGGYEIKLKNQTIYNTSCVIDYFQATDNVSWVAQQNPTQPSKFFWKLFNIPEYLEQASRLIKISAIRHGRNDFMCFHNFTKLVLDDFNETKFTSGVNSSAFSYMIQTGLLSPIQNRSAYILPNLRARNQLVTDLFYYFEKVANFDLKLIGSQLGDFFNAEKNYTAPRINLMESLAAVFGKLKPIYFTVKKNSTRQMKSSADFTYHSILHLSALTNQQVQVIEDFPQPVKFDKGAGNDIVRAVTLVRKNGTSLLIKASDLYDLKNLINQRGKYPGIEKEPGVDLMVYLAIRVEPDSRVLIDVMTSKFVDEVSHNTTYHFITSLPRITKPTKPRQNRTKRFNGTRMFNGTGRFFKTTTLAAYDFDYN